MAAFAAAVLVPSYALDLHAQQAKRPASTAKTQAPNKQPGGADGEAQAKAAAQKKRQDPAEAQRAIETANKLIQTGKAEQATQTLTATLAGGNLPPAIMAKALYLRGIGYRKQNKPAQAISDLTSALWLKGGLAEDERADATKQRSAAYADAGLTETGEPVAASPVAKERQASTKGWGTTTSSESSNNSAPPGGNWFKDWFGGFQANSSQSSSSPNVTGSVQKAEAPAPTTPAASTKVGSAWSSKTEVQSEKTAPPVGRTSAPAAAKFEGRFRVQLATVRTEQEALALAQRAKRELAGAIAGREPEIDQAVVGNMGSFYRVRVGPFATMQETQVLCGQVKGTAFDCMTVTQ
jgi:hypothetical protein